MILAAIHSKLSGVSAVTDNLATFDFGDGNQRPAIFTYHPAPRQCEAPLVSMEYNTRDDNGGTLSKKGDTSIIRIYLWADKTESRYRIRTMARAVYDALARKTLTVSGYTVLVMSASEPMDLLDAEGYPGAVLNIETYKLED